VPSIEKLEKDLELMETTNAKGHDEELTNI